MTEHIEKRGAMQFDQNRLVKDTTIQYVLPLSERPRNPNKLWRGKITATFVYDNNKIGMVQVECIEPGYEGCSELVHLYQIRAIEPDSSQP
jgi:hypothetical protein